MGQFSFQYPVWTIGLCLIIALIAGLALYYKTSQLSDRTFGQKLLLSILRVVSVLLILLLLLNPLYKYFKQTIQKPILVFAQDVSSSIISKDSSFLKEYIKQRELAKEALSEKYEIAHLEFSDQTQSNKNDIYNGRSTNINSVFEYISNQLDLQNVKAVILATDGIYNSGKNPSYQSILKQIPVYPILFGDTLQERDLFISNLFHNEIIYAGDKFAVQADIQSWNLQNEKSNIQLQIFQNGNWLNLQSDIFTIGQKKFFYTKEFIVPTAQAGIFRYRITCTILPQESSIKNNTREFYIEVLDSKKKLLVLINSPHPDIAAIKEALSNNKNYDIEIKLASEPIPSLAKYSLILMHQLPGASGLGSNFIAQAKLNKTPLVYIVGQQTDINAFNSNQDIVQITGSNKSFNESTPVYRPGFGEFTISDQGQSYIPKFPPLNCLFGNYKLDPTASVLFFQKIGNVETNYPLWICSAKSGHRISYILGEGIWKWKLNEFANLNSFNTFFELVNKTVQFTSTQEDLRKFRVNQNKRIFNEGEAISFNAEFYNDNFERINTPDAKLEIIGPESLKYEFSFSKLENYYNLNAGSLPKGDYSYLAKLEWNKKEFTVNGKFSIQALDLETNNRVADFDLLRVLATKSAGQTYYPSQLDQLTNNLLSNQQAKSIISQNLEINPLINQKWLFFIVFLCLAIEWFLRRYWGSY
ncbi:MAG: hypothetical protein WAS55_10330 [Saprospiraceae bacterium]